MASRQEPAHTHSRTARFCLAVVNLAMRWPVAVLAVTLVLVGVSIWLAQSKMQYRTQRNDLLSADKECQKRWQKFVNAFGEDDDLVIVVKGTDNARMKSAADALATRLTARPDQFDRVFHQLDLTPLHSRSLQYLSPEEIKAISQRLDGMGTLLGPLAPFSWQLLSLESLLTQAQAHPVTDAQRDLQKLVPSLIDSAAKTLRDPNAYQSPWSLTPPAGDESKLTEPQYFLTPDSRLLTVLARPRADSSSFTPVQDACTLANSILAELRPQYPDLEFGLTGLPVLETDEMAASDADSTAASWYALAGVAILYFVVYRGFRYPLLTVSTLLIGTCFALGWATITVGHLNILSATFAVMIIGMGDYGVLWVTHYDEERRRGATMEAAQLHTAIHAGPGILIAALTAALAFFATLVADFQAVAELGWIAGCGMLFCAMACLTWLPAVIVLVERRAKPRAVRTIAVKDDIFLPELAAQPRRTISIALVILAACALLAIFVKYDANLLHLQADGLDSVKWERELMAHSADATWDAVSLTPSREAALAMKAKYDATPGISRVVEAASLVPGEFDRKRSTLLAIQQKLSALPTTIPVDSASDIPNLIQLLGRTGDQELKSLLTTLPPREALERLRQFDRQLRLDLYEKLKHLRAVSEPRAITASDLPPSLKERYVAEGTWLVRAFAAESLWDIESLQRFTQTIHTVDPDATGKSFRTLEGLQQMKAGFLRAGVAALLVIIVVLWLDFRNVAGVLLGLLPLGAGLVVTLAGLVLLDMPLNPANLIALPLIIGVGLDNGVHVLHDYFDKRNDGPYRLSRVTGRGIFVSALTTILGFGTLMIARHRGMASLGFTLALGVTACMTVALIVLPALLQTLQKVTPRVRVWSQRRLKLKILNPKPIQKVTFT
ncbi:MMPL family transporter [soil metagenome]